MFRQKRKDGAISTLVGHDTRVHGDLEFTGGCLVDGYVKGNVKSVDDDQATLSISEKGCVEGSVMVANLMLYGTIKGDVKASQRVELGSNARVVGNVQYSLIEMAIGAEINGKLIHESEASQRKLVSPTAALPEQGQAPDKTEPVALAAPIANVKVAGD